MDFYDENIHISFWELFPLAVKLEIFLSNVNWHFNGRHPNRNFSVKFISFEITKGRIDIYCNIVTAGYWNQISDCLLLDGSEGNFKLVVDVFWNFWWRLRRGDWVCFSLLGIDRIIFSDHFSIGSVWNFAIISFVSLIKSLMRKWLFSLSSLKRVRSFPW